MVNSRHPAGGAVSRATHTSGIDFGTKLSEGTVAVGASQAPIDYPISNLDTGPGGLADVDNKGHSVVIGAEGITIKDGALTFIDQYGTEAINGQGFGSAWAKYIGTNVYNADFEWGEPGAGPVSATNLIPFWGVESHGTGLSVKTAASALFPSGRALQFTCGAGDEDDYLYVTQMVRINAGASPQGLYALEFTFTTGTTHDQFSSWSRCQYYKADGVTTTGASFDWEIPYSWWDAAQVYSRSVFPSSPPVDAHFMKIKIGILRSATGTETETFYVGDVRVVDHPVRIALPSSSANFSTGQFYKSGSTIFLYNNAGGTADAHNVRLTMSGAGDELTSYHQFVAFSRFSTGDWTTPVEGLYLEIADGSVEAWGDFLSYDILATKSQAGAVDDAAFNSATTKDGALVVMTDSDRLYMRSGGHWHYIAKTAGFEVPANETTCPVCLSPLLPDDDVVGKIDRAQPDGALHGLWIHEKCKGKKLDKAKADEYWGPSPVTEAQKSKPVKVHEEPQGVVQSLGQRPYSEVADGSPDVANLNPK